MHTRAWSMIFYKLFIYGFPPLAYIWFCDNRYAEVFWRITLMDKVWIIRTRQIRLAIAFVLIACGFLQVGFADAEQVLNFFEAARTGRSGRIEKLLADGTSISSQDRSGKTALHHAAQNGHVGTVSFLLANGIDASIMDNEGLGAYDYAMLNGHSQTASIISKYVHVLMPTLKYRDLAAFEKAIGKPGCLLKSTHVWFFAPKEYDSSARTILPYLSGAYDELHRITGIHTEYIIVVYSFPEGHKEAFGGTSNCVLYYDDSNLRLEDFLEWRKHKVPHVSGYIEEIAHNFVHAARLQFGWEMVGWSISVHATGKVAPTAVFLRNLRRTRQGQYETYKQYKKLDCTFPPDIPGNLVDRIHAYLLWQCEKNYGPDFWKDFFANAKARREDFTEAARLKGQNAARNRRYQLSVECFDALKNINFKKMLQQAGISLTTDIESLDPENKNWNRKLH